VERVPAQGVRVQVPDRVVGQGETVTLNVRHLLLREFSFLFSHE
jgi:hypothetical protein